jgi:hypothetical protein
MSRDEQAGWPDVDVTVMGAKWGAISGQHAATLLSSEFLDAAIRRGGLARPPREWSVSSDG